MLASTRRGGVKWLNFKWAKCEYGTAERQRYLCCQGKLIGQHKGKRRSSKQLRTRWLMHSRQGLRGNIDKPHSARPRPRKPSSLVDKQGMYVLHPAVSSI